MKHVVLRWRDAVGNDEKNAPGQDSFSIIDDICKEKLVQETIAKDASQELAGAFANVMKGNLDIALEIQNIRDEVLRRYMETIVRAALSAPWSREPGDPISKLIETFSPDSIVHRTLELSKQMWDRDPQKHLKKTLDYWRPAQTHVLGLMKAAIDATSAFQAGSSLMEVFGKFDPRAYFAAIDKLAWSMWHDSGCQSGTDRMDFWLAAEKHILALIAAPVAAAQTSSEAAAALDDRGVQSQ
jgi:hypothetical protein